MATIKEQFASNLVGHWDFRRGTYQDVDGTYPSEFKGQAAPTLTSKGYGYRLFDATNDYLQVQNSDATGLLIAGDIVFTSLFYLPEDVASNSYLMGAAGTSEDEADNILYSVRINTVGNNFTALHEYGAGTNVAANSTLTVSPGINFLAVSRDTTAKEYTFCLNGKSEVVSYSENPTGGEDGTFEIGAVQGIGSIDAVIMENMVFNTSMTEQQLAQMYADWQKEGWLTKTPEQTVLPKGSLLDYSTDPLIELDMVPRGDVVPNLYPKPANMNDPAIEGPFSTVGRGGEGMFFPGGTDERLDCGLTDIIHELPNASFCFYLEPKSFNDYEGWLTQGTSITNRTRIGVGGPGAGTSKDILINFANGGTAPSAYTTNTPLGADAPVFVRIEFDGSGATDADKIKCYVNEEEQTLTFSGDQPALLSGTASTLYIGDDAGAVSREFNGTMYHLLVFDTNLTDAEGAAIYEKLSSKVDLYALQEDMVETVGSIAAGDFVTDTEWKVEEGSVAIKVDEYGKYMEAQNSSTNAYIPCRGLYGTHQFDVNANTGDPNIYVQFCATGVGRVTDSHVTSYILRLSATGQGDQAVYLWKSVGGSITNLANTAANYFDTDKWYRVWVTVEPGNEINVYSQGLEDGSAPTLLTLDTGSFPVTDTAITSCEHFVFSTLTASGGRIKNIKYSPLVIDPTA